VFYNSKRLGLCHAGFRDLNLCSKAINHFVQLADDSEEVPDLTGGKAYSDFKLMKRDWEKIETVHEVLKVCIVRQCCFSACVTIGCTGAHQHHTIILFFHISNSLQDNPCSRILATIMGTHGKVSEILQAAEAH
jgi:hypothetical protein